jgi:hypothetical protein
MSNVVSINKAADEAFHAYCAAARRAQVTLDREDAEEAGRAWRRWLDIWMTREQREFIGRPSARVIPCSK